MSHCGRYGTTESTTKPSLILVAVQVAAMTLIVNSAQSGTPDRRIPNGTSGPHQLEVGAFSFPSALSVGSRVKVLCTANQDSTLVWYKDQDVLRHADGHNTHGSAPDGGVGGGGIGRGHRHFMDGIVLTELDDAILLTIPNVQPWHSGNYTCTARRQERSSSFSALLAVAAPPRWKSVPSQQITVSSQPNTLELRCEADGYPQPDVTWITSNGSTHRGNSVTLVSKNLVAGRAEYRCTASNEHGVIQHTVVIVFSRKMIVPQFALFLAEWTGLDGN